MYHGSEGRLPGCHRECRGSYCGFGGGKSGTGADFPPTTLELHLSGIIRTARLPNMMEIRIIGFFLENRLYLQFEAEKEILQTAVLGYIFIYLYIKH